MSDQFKNGFDVDTDNLAQFYRAFADGLESGDVAIREVDESHNATVDDVSVMSVSVEYVTKDSGLITPIEYTEDN